MSVKVPLDHDKIADFCRRHHVVRLSLFGSVLRDDFTPDSDVDVLVEFEPGHVPGFLRLSRIERELSGILGGHRVDMVTRGFLNRRIRTRILASAEEQYAQG